MGILKKLAGETVAYGLSNVLNRLLNYLIMAPYLTRVFQDERGEYGIHGIMYAFAALLMVMFTYGMETAFFRFATASDDKQKTFSTASISLLSSTLIFTAIIIFFSGDIASFLTRPEDGIYVVLFACIIAFDVLCAIPFALLRLENRPIRFAVFKIANILVNATFIIFLLEIAPHATDWYDDSKKLDYVFISNLIASAATLLLLLPIYFRFKVVFDVDLWKKMMVYAGPLVIVGIAGMINQISDRWLLQHLLPGNVDQNLVQVGIYNACIKLAVLMNLFTQAFKFAAEPFFFKHSDRSDSKQIYARVGQAFALVGSVVFLGIMLYIDFVQILIAKTFREGLNVVPVLLLAYLFLGIYYSFSVWYKVTDKTKIGAYISVVGAAVTLSLNFLLIPRIGLMGAAWSAFTCFFIMTLLSYWIGKKHYPVPYPLKRMVVYIVVAVGFYLLSNVIRPLVEHSMLIQSFVNTALLLAYLSMLFLMEKNGLLRSIFSREQGGNN